MLPCYGLFVEGLQIELVMQSEGNEGVKYTLATVCWMFWAYARTRLMQTFEPLSLPLCTSQEPPEVSGMGSMSRS